MRVIHFNDSGGYYGAERMILELITAQRAAGVDASLISYGHAGCGSKQIEEEAVRRGLPVTVWRGRFLARLRQFLATVAPDSVVHSHSYKFNVPLAMLPRRCCAVATAHGYTELRLTRKMGIYALLDRLALRRLDGAAFVAAKVAGDAQAKVDGKRLRIIDNGIAAVPPASAPLPERLAAFMVNRPVVLALGRLSPEKGLDTLIQAFALVVAKIPAAALVIAGDGPQRPQLEALVAGLGLTERVYFAGYIDGADALLAQAQVLAQPSHTEGMPMTVLEAMRLARPVVATPVGALPVLLAPEGQPAAGLLVAVGDAQGLAAALCRVLSEPGCGEALAMAGQHRFQQHYTSSAMAERYSQFYACCQQPEGVQP